MSDAPLVVIGDALLDRDVEGAVERLAPDAPVPVLDERAARTRPGGAALAAALAAAEGRPVTLVTALSGDGAGVELAALIAACGVELVDLGLDGPTPEKVRLRTAAGQPLLRLDRGGPGSASAVGRPNAAARAAIGWASAVLVADYGRGVAAEPGIRAALAERIAAGDRVPVAWDPHPRGPAPLSGVLLAMPNEREAAAFAPEVEGAGPAGGRRTCREPALPLGRRARLRHARAPRRAARRRRRPAAVRPRRAGGRCGGGPVRRRRPLRRRGRGGARRRRALRRGGDRRGRRGLSLRRGRRRRERADRARDAALARRGRRPGRRDRPRRRRGGRRRHSRARRRRRRHGRLLRPAPRRSRAHARGSARTRRLPRRGHQRRRLGAAPEGTGAPTRARARPCRRARGAQMRRRGRDVLRGHADRSCSSACARTCGRRAATTPALRCPRRRRSSAGAGAPSCSRTTPAIRPPD